MTSSTAPDGLFLCFFSTPTSLSEQHATVLVDDGEGGGTNPGSFSRRQSVISASAAPFRTGPSEPTQRGPLPLIHDFDRLHQQFAPPPRLRTETPGPVASVPRGAVRSTVEDLERLLGVPRALSAPSQHTDLDLLLQMMPDR
jgi:hypothetical protein